MLLDIERLTSADVDDAWALSTQAGWNQTKADWRRLLDLFPETCFAGRVDGTLVATSTLVAYGEIMGWIGMVLVDEDHRRQGFGSEIFEQALRAGLARELDVVGLDATDAGRAVYEQYGFETVVGIDRWIGMISKPTADAKNTVTERVESKHLLDGVISFDRRCTGIDRRQLLMHMLDGPETTGLVCEDRSGDVRGYAVVRPGRVTPQVGPLVAPDDRDAESLLAAAADRVDGPVVVDALRTQRTASLLGGTGLDVQRRLNRMTHEDPRRALSADTVVAAAGFEWG